MSADGVPYRETNEGRDTKQGIAGFEGANALWFIVAIALALVLFRQAVDHLQLAMPLALLIAGSPLALVSLYVFGLKQGKPQSYDIELFEWLLAKATKASYFSPRHVEPIMLPWVNPDRPAKKQVKMAEEEQDGQDR